MLSYLPVTDTFFVLKLNLCNYITNKSLAESMHIANQPSQFAQFHGYQDLDELSKRLVVTSPCLTTAKSSEWALDAL